jgi:hypothetical protein
MHKNATKCNETQSKWCINKHGASKIIDTFETYQGVRTAARLRLALVSVVVARWSSDLIVIFINFGFFVLMLMIINISGGILQKNKEFHKILKD